MASVDKRPGGRWRARWREYPGGPQKTKHFERKLDAERFLVDVQHKILSGTYVDPGLGRMTVATYYERWMARQVWRDSSRSAIESTFRRHVLPVLGARPLASVKRADVEAWARGVELAPSTVGSARQYLGTMFLAAVEDGLIPRSPCAGARMPKVDRAPVVPLGPEEVATLAEAAPAALSAAVVLAAGTGLRQGETTGLTVDRVDFLRRSLRVDRQLVTPSTGAPFLGPPKTASSYRTVPLPRLVVEALAGHLAELAPNDDGLVFHVAGKPIGRNRFGDLWRATAKRAGLPGVRFHDLRHHYASVLLSAGASIKAVQVNLGHASAKVTLDTYGHFMPDDEDRTRMAIDAAHARPAEDRLRTEGGAG